MRRWTWLLGLGISLLFLYAALRGLHLDRVWQLIREAEYIWLIPGVAVYMVGLVIRAWRWHYLLRPVASLPTRDLFPLVTIGYMGNNIFPARAGEALRAYLLKRKHHVPLSASLATILVERVYDGVVMLGFIFINLPELSRLTMASGFVGDIRTLALGGTVAFMGALVLLVLAAMFPHHTQRVLEPTLQRLPPRLQDRLRPLLLRFLQGLEALGSPWEALMILVTSLVIWLLETAKYWFVMHAFDFQVSFFALMLMNGVVNLATTLPSAPGYVGTFDAPGIAVLVAYGVPRAVAAGYTLTLHAALWFPVTALGAYYLMREGWSWRAWRSLVVSTGEATPTPGKGAGEP